MNRHRVLLVDDEIDFLNMMAAHFEIRLGSDFVKVETATSGNNALAKLREDSNYCLIITDYNMTNGNGGVLLNRAKKLGIPLVLITGGFHQDYPEFNPHRDVEIYSKPLDLDRFFKEIHRNYLTTPRLMRNITASPERVSEAPWAME